MPDYADAAARHWGDAEFLAAHSRWANADQLYGLAAECGLKAVLLGLGIKAEPKSGVPEKHKYHINELWPRFVATASGHQAGYATILGNNNPFANWLVDHRYDPSANFGQSHVQPHQNGALIVRRLMNEARLNGMPL